MSTDTAREARALTAPERRNFVGGLWHGAFLAVGMALTQPTTVIAAFVAELTGSTAYLFLKAGSFRSVCTVSAKTRPPSRTEIRVWLDRHEIHLFDPVSQKTIHSAEKNSP